MLTFNAKKLEVLDFDQDGEIEFSMSNSDTTIHTWLNEDEIKELISHLTKCLKDAGE